MVHTTVGRITTSLLSNHFKSASPHRIHKSYVFCTSTPGIAGREIVLGAVDQIDTWLGDSTRGLAHVASRFFEGRLLMHKIDRLCSCVA